jgi:hypothetical protein
MSRSRKRRREREQAGGSQATVRAGDSVVVKPGTLDPDFGVGIGGWQGRTLEGPDVDDMVLIAWDSVTLQHMPASVIEQSVQQGLDWTQMRLAVQAVESTRSRDTEADIARTIDELSQKYAWSFLGEEGKRVGEVLAGVEPRDEMAAMAAWEEYLNEHMVFPFEAEIDEYQERGPLEMGDRVRVKGISGADDLYGIIVRLTKRRRRYDCLLYQLKVIDEDSPNYQLVHDYRVWFANR